MSEYRFGDSDVASLRLALLARVFEPPSRRFLEECGPSGCELAVDVGCGPGFTTRLVREALGCARVVGLDVSASFVASARREPAPGIGFLRHDALDVPWPTGPADLVYARLLLTHLRDPGDAVRRFASQLRPGGRLLLDELEWIRTGDAVFARYLEIVERMLASRGQCLRVGPRLAALAGRLRVTRSEVREHEVDARHAAAMFSLNLEQIRRDAHTRAGVPSRDLDTLAGDLAALRAGGGPAVRWGLRQLVVEA